jgi:hypothetical protein
MKGERGAESKGMVADETRGSRQRCCLSRQGDERPDRREFGGIRVERGAANRIASVQKDTPSADIVDESE